jgi:hypothetical protein
MTNKSMMSLLSIRDYELFPGHIISSGALHDVIQEFVTLAKGDQNGNLFCINEEIFRTSE